MGAGIRFPFIPALQPHHVGKLIHKRVFVAAQAAGIVSASAETGAVTPRRTHHADRPARKWSPMKEIVQEQCVCAVQRLPARKITLGVTSMIFGSVVVPKASSAPMRNATNCPADSAGIRSRSRVSISMSSGQLNRNPAKPRMSAVTKPCEASAGKPLRSSLRMSPSTRWRALARWHRRDEEPVLADAFRASASSCRWLNSCAIWCVRKSSGKESRTFIR